MRTLGISPDEYQHMLEVGAIRVRADGLVCPDSLRRVLAGTA